MPYTAEEAAERQRNRARLRYRPKPKTLEAKPINLGSQKRAFISSMLADWDRNTTPLYKHMQDWQDFNDPAKYEMALEAMGQFFKVRKVSNRNIHRWMNQLAIDPHNM